MITYVWSIVIMTIENVMTCECIKSKSAILINFDAMI